MSYFSYPRIHFHGKFTVDPSTANNDDVMEGIDPIKMRLREPLSSMSDEEARDWLQSPIYKQGNPRRDGTAPLTMFLRAGWNYFGEHSTTFEDTVVSSVGGPQGAHTEDNLVGKPVYLLGSNDRSPAVLVDVDSTGLITTQIWLGGIQIGEDGDSLLLKSSHYNTRCYQRRLAFDRVLGWYGGEQNFVNFGCMWQFCIPTSALEFKQGTSQSSPILQALEEEARKAQGICVRFSCFETEPKYKGHTVARRFAINQGIPNPASAYLIGTIGVWNAGESETNNPGRLLVTPRSGAPLGWKSRDGNQYQPPKRALWLGNAVVEVARDKRFISVDLANTLPNDGYRYPKGFNARPAKADFGPLELAYIPKGGTEPVSIGDIPYLEPGYEYYRDRGEITDLALAGHDAEAISQGRLILRVKKDSSINPGVHLLEEEEDGIRITTDDRGIYLNPGEQRTIRLRVQERGGPVQSDVTLYLKEFYNTIEPRNVPRRPDQQVRPAKESRLRFEATCIVKKGQEEVSIPVTAIGEGPATLLYSTRSDMSEFDGLGPAWGKDAFTNFRIYPDDDYSNQYVGEEIPFQFVYREVLRYWYVLYPAMSKRINLNQEDAIKRNAQFIKERTEESMFGSTSYMPVTRDLSPGKRALLHRYLQQFLTKGGK